MVTTWEGRTAGRLGTLPLTQDLGAPPPTQPCYGQCDAEPGDAPAPSVEQLGAIVLVVDDDPEIRDVVRWLLEDEGWTVETASDGRDALERATRARPALIVLDMGLPILSGEEVAMRLHDVYVNPPPIIVVSADGRAGEKAARIGAASYLHKPFDVDTLARLVRRTLGSP